MISIFIILIYTKFISNIFKDSFCLLSWKEALNNGQLLRDIAWSRVHLLVIYEFIKTNHGSIKFLNSYEKILIKFPTPLQF